MVPEDSLFRRLSDGEVGKPYSDEENPLSISDEDAEITMRVPAGHATKLRVGDITLIYDFQKSDKNVWIGGRVQEISTPRVGAGDRTKSLYRESSPSMAELHADNQPTGETDPQLFTIEPICMFEEGSRKPNTVCPSNASSLLLPKLEETQWEEPPLQEILGLPKSGLQIGYYSQNQIPYQDPDSLRYQPYYLDLDSMMNKHMLMLGTSGTGKTVFLKLLAWQLAKDDRAVVAFDIQGDIIQLAAGPTNQQLDDVQGSVDEKLWDELGWDEIAQDGGAISSDDIQVFAPILNSENQYDEYRLQDVRRWCDSENVDFEEISIDFMTVQADRMPLYMPELTAKAANALPDLVRSYQKEGPASGNLDHFIKNFVTDPDTWSNDNAVWNDPDGNEVTRIHKSTYGNLRRGLGQLQSKGIFDVSQTACPSSTKIAQEGKITVIYLEHIFDDTVESIYEYWTPSLLLADRMEIPPTHMMIDEAHKVVPSPKISTDEYAKMAASSFVGIARVGRKYDLNLVIGTHKPRDINDVVYSLCGTSCAFRMDPKDLQKLDPQSWVQRSVPQYAPGFVAIESPENTLEPWVETKVPRIPVLHQRPGKFFDQISDH